MALFKTDADPTVQDRGVSFDPASFFRDLRSSYAQTILQHKPDSLFSLVIMTEILFEKIDNWKKLLLDFTKRNRLINTIVGGRNSLEVVSPDLMSVFQSLVSEGKTLKFPWKSELDVAIEYPVEYGTETNELPRGELEYMLEVSVRNIPKPTTPNSASKQTTETSLENNLDRTRFAPTELLTRLTDDVLNRKLKTLSNNSRESIEEHGINILYLGFGLVKWYENVNSEEFRYSPIYLVPVQIYQASFGEPWSINLHEDEALHNQSFWEYLRKDFNLELPEPPANGIQNEGEFEDFINRIKAAFPKTSNYQRWKIEERLILECFYFQKLAMWKDLDKNMEKVAENPLCRLIAGDNTAMQYQPNSTINPEELDKKVHPREMLSILDADSSQQKAIQSVLLGTSIVLDGPPGTGKSQTIANIIAEMLARDKKVLFVSEKSAAIEVVKQRLDERDLGDFCLDCHALFKKNAGKKSVLGELERCMNLQGFSYPDCENEYEELHILREKLSQYVEILHTPLSDLKMSIFQAHGRFLRSQTEKCFQSEFPNPHMVEQGMFSDIRDCFKELSRNPTTADPLNHPWKGCLLKNARFELPRVKETMQKLAEITEQCEDAARTLADNDIVPHESSRSSLLDSLKIVLRFYKHVDQNPKVLVPREWFDFPADELSKFLHNANKTITESRLLLKNTGNFRPTFGLYFFNPKRYEEDYSFLDLLELPRELESRFVRNHPPALEEQIVLMEKLLMRLSDIIEAIERIQGLPFPEEIAPEQIFHQPLDRILQYAKWGIELRKLPSLNLLNLDSGHDERISNVLGIREEYRKKMQKSRDKLEGLSSLAFHDPDAAIIAARGRLFKGFLRRFLARLNGKWKKWQDEVSDFYNDEIPNANRLQLDMSELEKFREVSEKIARIENDNSDLISNIEFSTFKELLHIRRRMNELFTEASIDRMKAMFVRTPNSQKFFHAAEDLHDKIGVLKNLIASLSLDFGIDYVSPSRNYMQIPLEEYIEFVKFIKDKIEKHREALLLAGERIVGVPTSSVDEFLAKGRQIRELSRKMLELRREHEKLTAGKAFDPGFDAPDFNDRLKMFLSFEKTFRLNITSKNQALGYLHDFRSAMWERIVTCVRSIKRDHWKNLESWFPLDSQVSTGITIDKHPLSLLSEWFRDQANSVDSLEDWTKYNNTVETLNSKWRMESWVEEIENGEIDISNLENAFLEKFYHDWLRHAYSKHPTLENFSEEAHKRLIEKFRTCDKNMADHAIRKTREKLLSNPARPNVWQLDNAPASSDVGILRAEFNKKRKIMSIRQLFSKVPDAILRLKPCIMMSPLTVSTYLQNLKQRFDLVIFDEASQILPQDAIGAIYRGKQLVIAGDRNQLPPTAFFQKISGDSQSGEDVESGDIENFESILDLCAAKLPRERLRWHYRSRREGLIAFSNHHIYGNELITFPSTKDSPENPAVKFEFVKDGYWIPGDTYNPIEARRTAELVFQFFVEKPGKSLGVITLNQKQQEAVKDEIEKIRRDRPEMENLYQRASDEDSFSPFFVKNLENVQGDERDHIIISVGYGKPKEGRMNYNFGPLGKSGGERRLNVAITRAKYGIILVSSIKHLDIDISRAKGLGVKLLRDYLNYAENGVACLGAEISESHSDECDSPFEEEVAKSLKNEGFEVRHQIGCSGYRIDLALTDPERPGNYVLGIECDGATYHSGATARDRDRLRQQVLEGLGWTIHRIWSTDWIADPKKQIDKVKLAYDFAKKKIDNHKEEEYDGEVFSPLDNSATVMENSGTPIAMKNPFAITHDFNKIEDVPDNLISSILRDLLGVSSMNEGDLVKKVSQKLGFKKLGHKIESRIKKEINKMIAQGHVKNNIDCLSLNN